MKSWTYWLAAAACAIAVSAVSATIHIRPEIAKAGLVPDAGNMKAQPATAVAKAAPVPNCNNGVQANVYGTTASFCGQPGGTPVFIDQFLGIQYATAARWGNPNLTVPASGVITGAQSYGNECPQLLGTIILGNEDCLELNIFAPHGTINNRGANLPVMVFIHGGAFISGSGGTSSSTIFDGTALANQGVVVVTLNYRLGPLGFLVSTADGTTASGNYGLMDQQKALQWVAAYIANFGGNPGNVTLFGESAGAMSVGLHTFDVPTSESLFKNAILESDPMGEKYLHNTALEHGARIVGDQFIAYVCQQYIAKYPSRSCTGDWAKSADALPLIVDSELAFLTPDIAEKDIKDGYVGLRSLPWQPVKDDSFVYGQPYEGYSSYVTARKPIMFGVNAEEGVLFAELLALVTQKADTPAGGSPPYIGDEPTIPEYKDIVEAAFPLSSGKILKNMPYAPILSPPLRAGPYSGSGMSFARLVTDFSFLCGNLAAADKALPKNGTNPIYFYYFSQLPFFDTYALIDNGACAPWPATSNTCHGNELPYVFSTLNKVGTPGTGDTALSNMMSQAWATFAKNPASLASMGSPWFQYSNAGANAHNASQLNSSNYSPKNINTQGWCSAMWNTFAPYGP